MEQNKIIEQPITFTSEELAAQGYANPSTHPALAQAERPITFTQAELEAQGYANSSTHPAVETAANTIKVRDESAEADHIPVTTSDIAEGVRFAAERRAIAKLAVDGTTGTVLLPSEAARGDRGAENTRR